MICPKCGTENSQEYRFCVKCGGDLSSSINNNMMNNNQNNLTGIYGMPANNNNQVPNNNNNNTFGFNLNNNQPTNNGINTNQTTMSNGINTNQATMSNGNNTSSLPVNQNLFKTILNSIIKPISTTKEELTIFDNFKAAGLTAALVAALATIITLVITIINVVRVQRIFSDEIVWEWDRLKYFDFFKTSGTIFLVFAGAILLLAGTYYVASLITKKKAKFQNLLATCSISILPAIISISILSPILSKIYLPLGLIISGVGIIYTIVILFEHINKELSLDNDKKIYVNIASVAAFLLVAYFVGTKIMSEIIETDISSISGIFG